MKLTLILAMATAALAGEIVNNEASSNPRKLHGMHNVLTQPTAPQDRSPR
jgi:hypothetical protein